MRRLYPLQPKVKIQTDFYVFDTETGSRTGDVIKWELKGRPESFIFGVVYGENFTKVIHSHNEMVNEFKDSRYKNKKVFAHNFGGFDGSVLFDNIFFLDPSAIFAGSKFISCTNGNCTFADSLNIFQTSIKKIGEMIGIEKLGMNDGDYLQSTWPADESKDINGCIRDCEIIFEALAMIFTDAGDIKLTQASLSLTYFRRFHMDFWIEHDPDLTKHFFTSYYGGRTEVFKLGKTHSRVIDVNSMYPYAMKHCHFPNPKSLKIGYPTIDEFLTKILPNYEGCIYCTIEHPANYFGLLPFRNISNGKLTFPIGIFFGCWNFIELRFFISHGGTIKKIEKIVYAPRMVSPFEKFVDILYHKRVVSSNKFERDRIKIFLNSLYGKFAQRITETQTYIFDMVEQYGQIREAMRDGTFIRLIPFSKNRLDCFLVERADRMKNINYSIPSFASYITSFARVMIAEKLLAMKNNKPVYCDTDSIFFELGEVETGTHLGQWKLEEKIVTEIKGLKNYKFIENGKEFERIKGVPTNATKTGPSSYEYFNLLKTKESLVRNLKPGVKTKRTKKIAGLYDKRTVTINGETIPIKL